MTHFVDNKIMRMTMTARMLRLCSVERAIRMLLLMVLAAGSATAMADGVVVHGSVYGGGNKADVETNTEVNISTGQVEGNVYGGGNLGDVGTILKNTTNYNYTWRNTDANGNVNDTGTDHQNSAGNNAITTNNKNTGISTVRISGGTIGTVGDSNTDYANLDHGNVYGGGKGKDDATFFCQEGMVYATSVTISGGTTVYGTVYGGGQIGRVEDDTKVTISGTSNNGIKGNVFGAGKGLETHDHSALVRGNSTVTVQGNAKIGRNVYGGGEKSTVGRYWVKGVNNISNGVPVEGAPEAPTDLPDGMPYQQQSGGVCSVFIQGSAQVGPDGGASDLAGHVFGAGKGVEPHFVSGTSQKMTGTGLVTFENDSETGKTAEQLYLEFLQTLALATNTYVTIDGSAKVKGSVMGGSENGFVQTNTNVLIQGSCEIGTTTYGNVYGGGRGLIAFAEAGIVKGKTEVDINGGTTNGSVYGGGSLGDVIGTTEVNIYTKVENGEYVAVAKGSEAVTIAGNVYGGGKGDKGTFTCEKAMVGIDGDGIANPAGGTTVRIGNGIVNGNVYGGGEVGRVEKNTVVTIGFGEGGTDTSAPYIKGDVFGAGAGANTHGFSALVRGNSTVTVQGDAKIGKSVYGGGEIATVGRYIVVDSRPTKPAGGGLCSVTVKGHAIIGQDSEGDVFGAGKGVLPYQDVSGTPWSMLSDDTHKVYSTSDKADYFAFIQTLALTGDTEVSIGENASVKGSVYGGSENGFVQRHTQVTVQGSCEIGTTSGSTDVDGDIFGGGRGADTVEGYAEAGKVKGNTLLNIISGTIHGSVYGGGEMGYTIGSATVNMMGGTVNHNVFGGGALADSNTGNGTECVEVTGLATGSSVTGLFENTYVLTTDQTAVANKTYYEQSGSGYVAVTENIPSNPQEAGLYEWSETVYEETTDGTAVANKRYYTKTHPTTVNLLGGTIKSDAYGGGLGRLAGTNVTAVEAKVYGDVKVNLNGMAVSEYTSAFSSYVSPLDLIANDATPIDYYMVPNATGTKGCIVNRVFGCNDLNGSPQSNVTVSVYGTQNKAASKATIGDKFVKNEYSTVAATLFSHLSDTIAIAKVILPSSVTSEMEALTAESAVADINAALSTLKASFAGYISESAEKDVAQDAIDAIRYDVKAVYGGGNEAAYIPLSPWNGTTGSKSHVIIHGCEYTSIETVYGGGNAAPAPETNVDIYSSYEIENAFGGGNGRDRKESNNAENPGANVGKYNNGSSDVSYGTGNATTWIYGGTVHEAYGGSNERGTIYGNVTIDVANENPDDCTLDVTKIVGAGKNADVDGDLILIMGCKPENKIPLVYGGADNANVNGNVELTIISGNFGKVFGGNNEGGAIKGHIILNIEETGNCETPITIDELYLGGNMAAYSMYGYYQNGTTSSGKPKYAPRKSATDTHLPTDYNGNEVEINSFTNYDPPVLNVVSCTRIGQVFGGGYGTEGTMYADPTVNINMIPGALANLINRNGVSGNSNVLGEIGDVFGGGNAADVYGNPTVNIGTETTIEMTTEPAHLGAEGTAYTYNSTTKKYENVAVAGAYITGNVYGGGKLANVGYLDDDTKENDPNSFYYNTHVNIGAKEVTEGGNNVWKSVAVGTAGVTIGGNVYGGGEGVADVFKCDKAMVVGNTNVIIGNGTVGTLEGAVGSQTLKAGTGNVYGGGKIARVERSSEVTIGLASPAVQGGTSAPVILNDVFAAGAGIKTHGYSALVRRNSTVTVQGNAKVKHNVYGGGEIASVGRFKVKNATNASEAPSWLPMGMPFDLISGGVSTVTVRGNAVIGPDAAMTMPDFKGHVFGAGKGITPGAFSYEDKDNKPKRMSAYNPTSYPAGTKGTDWDYVSATDHANVWEYFEDEAAYFQFLETLAMSDKTVVTIGNNAQGATDKPFIKGSVYGGSENGHVRTDAYVKVQSGQIGCATEMNAAYEDNFFINPASTAIESSLATCPSWTYTDNGYTYDKFADASGNYSYTGDNAAYAVIPEGERLTSSEGGRPTATDGHTFYGNVFGGGSGYFPFAPGKWYRGAGSVGGDTRVDIEGGHVLSNVYGGNEQTDVGTYRTSATTEPESGGNCIVNIMGGTVGVPRTKTDIQAHPVIGNVFGAGKGDKRVLFNTWTNVWGSRVNVSGGIVYGSVFGGGEDGHVLGNDSVYVTQASGKTITIGSTGESGADGNVFGGGRGSETALTAGVVGGNVLLEVNSGTILGSVYGGGRLASVGTNFVNPTIADPDHEGQVIPNPNYGKLQTPEADHGNISVTINGGTIGTVNSTGVGGNVFGASKGLATDFNLGIVRSTTVNMTDGRVFASVFGGGELAQVVGSHTTNNQALGTEIVISGGSVGINQQGKGGATWGNVYGGGKGNTTNVEAGLVKSNTMIKIENGTSGSTTTTPNIYHNIYGGGAYGSVGEFNYHATTGMPTGLKENTSGGKATIYISGGIIGISGQNNGMVFGSSRGDVGAPGEIHDKLAWVYDTSVTIGDTTTTSVTTTPLIKGSIYGGGENGHIYHNAWVRVHGGTIGIASGADVGSYKAYNYPHRGNVYGGGCGTDKYYSYSPIPEGSTLTDGEGDKYNPLAGIVQGDARVTIDGGHVVHNVYGAGAMGSVGTITNFDDLDKQENGTYLYKHVDATDDDGKESYYNFGLSWPYKFTYNGTTTGQTTVNISGGAEIGVTVTNVANESDKPNGGHVFGAARGAVEVGESNIANHRYVEAKLANVRAAQVIIGTTSGDTQPTIRGSVYGGGEDGHVYEDATVTINKGTIGHSVFGGGKGESQFKAAELWAVDPNNDNSHLTLTNQNAYSWTAGRVYGNTTVTMNGGSVGYFIYGGGNLASVGKGNYSGGSDDYSTDGYGELPPSANQALWSNTDFTGSGQTTVNILGGRVGPDLSGPFDQSKVDQFINDDGLPYGSVFGGCRGKAAASVQRSPRYRYMPDFFLGYVNKAIVNIGDADKIDTDGYTGPTITGSVYGGGQDGHVRNNTKVNINKAQITGQGQYESAVRSGNVFGAGSGIGTYMEGNVAKCNNSSGSVTCTSEVTLKGGTISGCVYGGGAMASVGPPKTSAQNDFEGKAATETKKSFSYTKVVLEGGTIGGDVYGASRGPSDSFLSQMFPVVNNVSSYDPDKYATDIWSEVVMSSGSTAVVNGSVYGGGEGGRVKKDTQVDLLGGTIKGDAYGGGKGTTYIEANIGGDVDVTLDGTAFYISKYTDEGYTNLIKSGRVFGCNNLYGTPQGNVTVTVNRTVEGNTPRTLYKEETVEGNIVITDKRKSNTDSDHSYELAAVYGGGNLAPYKPDNATGKKAHVIIRGCEDTSILTVFGGGNAAPVPETQVDVYSCYEIGALFGGGNGRDKYKNSSNVWTTNPGANVGMLRVGTENVMYGSGNATTTIYGGTVHEAYGGSDKKGTIYGNVSITTSTARPQGETACPLDVAKIVAAGKNADVEGDLIVVMDCSPSDKIPQLFAGADDANVNGNVELTITSGNFGQVFGGNNAGGFIRGHIKLNIEEWRTCETPITIDELYLGGNEAAYSQYGYYISGNDSEGDPIWAPITREMTAAGADHQDPYDDDDVRIKREKAAPYYYANPELNIVSCTYIGKVFGGGLGTTATIHGDPVVNINMIPGSFANDDSKGVPYVMSQMNLPSTENTEHLGVIGTVYGGGNEADVDGNPTVNIGTAWSVEQHEEVLSVSDAGVATYKMKTEEPVLGAYIIGNVFGGGKGEAKTTAGTAGEAFLCAKAMVNGGVGTHVNIGNGFVKGNVYGGGEVGRVEHNTAVKIGLDEADVPSGKTSAPVIKGSVFGAGAGVNTHGYSALVRGNSTVTVQADSKVEGSVYGGGEIASVGKYRVVNGLPVALDPDQIHPNSGYCYVYIRGNAEIGPDDMVMNNTTTGKPDDSGHVFGAGKGVLPYEGYDDDEAPFHMNGSQHLDADGNWDGKSWDDVPTDYDAYDPSKETTDKYKNYTKFIKSLALATQTEVTISGNPFIKGSVYGGSENGFVQHDTHVTISGGQIGNGYVQMDEDGNYLTTKYSLNRRYDGQEWTDRHLIKDGETNYAHSLPECASWPYGQAATDADKYAPYDKDANKTGDLSKYANGNSTEGGRAVGDDGHTFYGNVFGGGSGYFPYKPGRWFEDAGAVYGNTVVDITGGHILTSIYGGNEMTNVSGKCTVNFGGTATLGVPRTLKQIDAHPVTCYLFGAGKGDPRIFFNKQTNVEDVEMNITGGTIYGSVFGGGEDGHVLRDVTMTIGTQTTTGEGDQAVTTTSGPTIGTWGTSYVDGNVFGGGRGFSGDAYTAGNVAGSVTMEIKGGSILGSIYGGGRLGSVGYGLFDAETNNQPTKGYGEMREDDEFEDGFSTQGFFTKGRGHIDITISGGTIGNTYEYIAPKAANIPEGLSTDFSTWNSTDWTTWKAHNNISKTEFDTSTGQLTHTKGGNVFAGGMGRLYKLDGTTYISDVDWWKLGCVKSTKLTITGGTIKSNVYGGGELGQVVGHHEVKDAQGNTVYTDANNSTPKVTGTEIIIQGNSTIIGTEITKVVTESHDGQGGTTTVTTSIPYTFGNVFGSGYGSAIESITVSRGGTTITSNPSKIAGIVEEDTNVDMQGGEVKVNIYGGGELAGVKQNTYVSMAGGTVKGNVFGGGKGASDNFTCDKAMVGLEIDNNACQDPGSNDNKNKGTHVSITNGEVGTLANGKLVEGTGNVYGGGEIARVEWNTEVKIGVEETDKPVIEGDVFGAGKGLDTHGYSALVRGNSTVTVQGKANVKGNVYGGGELATVGRYWVKNIPAVACDGETEPNAPTGLPDGMPYQQRRGGICSVIIQGEAQIGPDSGGTDDVGHVFGAGKGVNPHFVASGQEGASQKMVKGDGNNPDRLVDFTASQNQTAEEAYLEFLQTLALVTNSNVTIDGKAKVKGSVFGGSESGFVQHDTDVKIKGSCEIGTTTYGNVFGGGKGLEEFAEAGKVKGNTKVEIINGTVKGNVYGGGSLGDVGIIDKTDKDDDGQLTYNYAWKKSDGSTPNDTEINKKDNLNTNTGICTVTVSGGTIGTGVAANADGVFANGNVYGAGKGSSTTWWCEKAITYATNVTISDGTVYGTVYGGGEVGRVEDDAKVTIGASGETEENKPNITGSVFGGGAGLQTHGYSALVRGNSEVTVQGKAKVGGNVYGGGEIASVGRFKVDKGLPTKPKGGGTCTVAVKENAVTGDVYGSCKGVTPKYVASGENRSKSMQLYDNRPKKADGTYKEEHDGWEYYETYPDGYKGTKFIWRIYTEEEYLAFLPTLGLASNTHVTIGGSSIVNGSVFGGGQRGLTLGGVDVNITGGTVNQDVYGGGALANSNSSHWHEGQRTEYVELTELLNGSPVKGYYTAEKVLITEETPADENATYYAIFKTNVNLKGGTVVRNVYGGGLGQLAKAAVAAQAAQGNEGEDGYVPAVPAQDAVPAIEAKVYGDVLVKLNEDTDNDDCKVKGNIFGCNNLNGSPQSAVTVHIYKTEGYDENHQKDDAKGNSKFDLNAVYGGGNLAAFVPDYSVTADTAVVRVFIDGCDKTSIGTVYGGGNAASVPATEVVVNGTYEIGQVFGGGNGADDYQLDGKWYDNPGANVGYKNYTHLGTGSGTASDPIMAENNTAADADNKDASTKEKRIANYGYGLGKTHATIFGGTVHEVYGGSNKRGNVRVEARTTLEDEERCAFDVGEAYGGGNNAPMDGDAVLEIGCISGLDKACGGAADADVNGDIVLNITNGTYDQVFGGNDAGGAIRGSITVNIEETGCRPIIIGELYGGGCEAAYSVYGYDSSGNVLTSGSDPVADPVVNVKSFTSIGNIYGGGYGAAALMVGNPVVNIDVTKGKYYNESGTTASDRFTKKGFVLDSVNNRYYKEIDKTNNPHTIYVPVHEAGKIGAIYNVFGGGNAAGVIGTPHVNVGTRTGEVIPLMTKPLEDSEGKDPTETDWSPTYQLATAEGIKIIGDVFGGGNAAEVDGDTKVVVGRNKDVKTYSFTSYDGANGDAWSSGLAQTTGATATISDKKYSEVVILTNGKYGSFVGKKFYVDSDVTPGGSSRTQLYDADKNATSLYVAIKEFELNTYTFTSSNENGSTTYSTGTASPTGNYRTFDGTEHMQIVVLTNPGFDEWVGRTFYVPANADITNGTRYQLRKSNGEMENVWVTILKNP